MHLKMKIQVRVTEDLADKISAIVDKHQGEKYDSESHFIRCAIIRLLREEEKIE